jgi:NADH:ubiquinone oxidoreductase subunit 4 (subunit M)
MKRIIAYSSVAHMNMAMVSLCSLNSIGVYSSIYLMLSHGLIASGLFFLVGFLYNRFHVRSVYYYGGLATMMPLMSFFFFLFTLANMAFPLTSGFIGEFLLLLGISINNFYMAFLNSFSMLLTTVYSVLLFGRVFLGELKPWFQNMIQQVIEFELLKNINKNTNKGTNYVSIGHIKIFYPTSMPSLFKSISHYDIYYYELIIVLTLFIGIVFLGVYPQIIFTYLQQSMVLTEIINTMLLPYPQDFYVLKNALPTNFYIEYLNIKIFYSDIILKIFFFSKN